MVRINFWNVDQMPQQKKCETGDVTYERDKIFQSKNSMIEMWFDVPNIKGFSHSNSEVQLMHAISVWISAISHENKDQTHGMQAKKKVAPIATSTASIAIVRIILVHLPMMSTLDSHSSPTFTIILIFKAQSYILNCVNRETLNMLPFSECHCTVYRLSVVSTAQIYSLFVLPENSWKLF